MQVGIDLGGTKIEGIVLGADSKEMFRLRIDTEQNLGYDHILSRIKMLFGYLKKETRGKPFTLGIGVPGAVSKQDQRLKNSNTACLNGKPLKQDLERILERSFMMQNDANCFCLAEALKGKGQGKDWVFGVIMGTGCGGGISVNQKIHTGLQSIAGEWGHMSMDSNGPACYCGRKGCAETFISGGGLERRFERETGKALPLKEIVIASRTGDRHAGAFMKNFMRDFGRAMGNLINILDPDIVILGGGVSNIDELYTDGIDEVRKHIFGRDFKTPIVRNSLGDSAGVIGAALIGV